MEQQQQGFHERELKRIMELEKMREEVNHVQTRSAQLEANLALAQEMNEQLLEDSKAGTAKIAEEMEKRLEAQNGKLNRLLRWWHERQQNSWP